MYQALQQSITSAPGKELEEIQEGKIHRHDTTVIFCSTRITVEDETKRARKVSNNICNRKGESQNNNALVAPNSQSKTKTLFTDEVY